MTKLKVTNALFPDFNDLNSLQFGSPPTPTPATARSPAPFPNSSASPISPSGSSPPRERRLSFSSDFERNKYAPNPAMTSSPLDGFFGLGGSPPLSPSTLVPPPHLTTPPLNAPKSAPLPSVTPLAPTRPTSRPASPTSSTPTPISRMTAKSSFEFGRVSLEDLSALTSGLAAATPLTPKPAHIDLNSRAPSQQPSLNVPFPQSSMPKSPPQIAHSGGHPPSTASVLIPNRPTPQLTPNLTGPSPAKQYSLTSASPNKGTVYAPLSPPLSRHHHAGNGSAFDNDAHSGIQRRFSEPPPVDTNLLFPGIRITFILYSYI